MKKRINNPFGFKPSPQKGTFSKPAIYYDCQHLIMDPSYMMIEWDTSAFKLRLPACSYSRQRGKWYEWNFLIEDPNKATGLIEYALAKLNITDADRVLLHGIILRIQKRTPMEALSTCTDEQRPYITALLS